MKKLIKVLTLAVIVTVCIMVFCFGASAESENGYIYSISDGEATITGLVIDEDTDEPVITAESTEVVIPSMLGGYPVTAIGDEVFMYTYGMTSLVIPEGVETIGKYCFCNCDWLEEIRFPSTLKYVGNRAFDDDCFIRKLYITDIASYIQIEYESLFSHPFWYDDEDGFEWWEEEYEKKLYIGDSTEPVTDVVIPEGTERISDYAFYGNTFLKSVTLPDTLTGIGAEAFYKCENLESVSFGHCLEHIEASAFECCYKLGSFTLPDSLLTIGEWAFCNNETMTEVTIPDKVKEIPEGAFSYCVALETVNIGSGVETIGLQAFQNIGATEFIIPDNVKSVGRNLFHGSKKLETVVFGDGLITVDDYPFNQCYNLKSVTIGDGLTELSDKFFKVTEHVDDTKDKWIKLERLNTGDGITALPTEVLDKDTLKEIVIGDGITSIADNQFAYYSKLEKAVLNDNITAIGNNVFYFCSNLSELKMPEKLESIGNNAFAYCKLLPEIVIPEKVVSVGDDAFSGCTSAGSVTFEGSELKALGNYAFGGCSSITSITVPDGVTHIGSDLFYQCESLREINLPDSIISIKSGLISSTPYDDDYDYYEDMLYIGNHLIYVGNYDMPAKYIVRKGTKSIAQYAFSNQHSLETVVIHKGLVSMDDDVFNDCPNLTKIGFTGTEAEWNDVLKGNNDFSSYDIEFNYYVCSHENTENKEAVSAGCNNYGYTEGVYCNDCDEWIKGHIQLAMSHRDNDGDAVCDECQAVVSDITIDEYKTVGSGEFEDDLTFVAPATGSYTIVSFSEGVIDPRVDLCDSEYVWLHGNDEQDGDYGNDNYDFRLTCTLEKGTTYHFIITTWCEGDFQVLLTFDCEHTGGTATCKEKAECTSCGMKYGALSTVHTYDNACDAECNVCKATRTPSAHKGGTATCKAKAVCTVCGSSYGSLADHSYSAATCTAPKSCKVCGVTTGKSLGHKYSNSCDTTCNTCSAKRSIKHTYSNACDKECNVCKAKRSVSHSYKTTTTKATLKKNGKTVTKCSVCGDVKSTKTVYYPKTIKLSATSYTYNGKVKTPTVTVKDSKGNTLKRDTDYTVKYSSGRKNPGKFTVTITFKGKYEGKKKLTFTIKPKAVSLSKVTAGSKQATANWKTVSGVSGYEVQYSTSNKFKSAKTATVKNGSSKKTTIKKLTKGKTYYFKVRAYKTVDGKKIYGAWSSVKSVKIK